MIGSHRFFLKAGQSLKRKMRWAGRSGSQLQYGDISSRCDVNWGVAPCMPKQPWGAGHSHGLIASWSHESCRKQRNCLLMSGVTSMCRRDYNACWRFWQVLLDFGTCKVKACYHFLKSVVPKEQEFKFETQCSLAVLTASSFDSSKILAVNFSLRRWGCDWYWCFLRCGQWLPSFWFRKLLPILRWMLQCQMIPPRLCRWQTSRTSNSDWLPGMWNLDA